MSEGQNATSMVGAGTQPGAAGAAANSSSSQGGTTTSEASGWQAGLSEDLRGFVQNKGFKDPAMVLDSYRNLEKLIGAPKERLVTLPEKADDPAWQNVYDKLGRPQKPEEYGIKVPEGGSKDFADWASKTFHELGLSRKQAEALAGKWNDYNQNVQTQTVQDHNLKVTQEETALKKEWGAAYDQNVNIAKRAVHNLGIKAEVIDKLESAMGYAEVFKFMHNLGAKLGEDKFVGASSQSGFNSMYTPEGARNRIETLRQDNDFVRRYVNGDVGAREEMNRLHKMAYPDN